MDSAVQDLRIWETGVLTQDSRLLRSPVVLYNCLYCWLGSSFAPFPLRGLYLPYILRSLPCLFYQPFSPSSVLLSSNDLSLVTLSSDDLPLVTLSSGDLPLVILSSDDLSLFLALTTVRQKPLVSCWPFRTSHEPPHYRSYVSDPTFLARYVLLVVTVSQKVS